LPAMHFPWATRSRNGRWGVSATSPAWLSDQGKAWEGGILGIPEVAVGLKRQSPESKSCSLDRGIARSMDPGKTHSRKVTWIRLSCQTQQIQVHAMGVHSSVLRGDPDPPRVISGGPGRWCEDTFTCSRGHVALGQVRHWRCRWWWKRVERRRVRCPWLHVLHFHLDLYRGARRPRSRARAQLGGQQGMLLEVSAMAFIITRCDTVHKGRLGGGNTWPGDSTWGRPGHLAKERGKVLEADYGLQGAHMESHLNRSFGVDEQ